MFLEVALPLPLRQTFYYRCPSAEFPQIQIGQRVLVPFQNRKLTGYVIRRHPELPSGSPEERGIKEILGPLDGESLVSPELFELAVWVSDYYFAPLGEVLRSCFPAKVNLRSQKKFSITSLGLAVLHGEALSQQLSSTERAILGALSDGSLLDARQLQRRAAMTAQSILLAKLAARSWIRVEQILDRRTASEKQQWTVVAPSGRPVKNRRDELSIQ